MQEEGLSILTVKKACIHEPNRNSVKVYTHFLRKGGGVCLRKEY